MSASFSPGWIVAGMVLAEATPFDIGATMRFRGVELFDQQAPWVVGRSSYRVPGSGPEPMRRVEVCTVLGHDDIEEYFLEHFQQIVSDWVSLGDPRLPQVLHTFGRDGRVRAMVLEHLEGQSLGPLLAALHQRGQFMPVEVALAIAHQIIALHRRAGSMKLEFVSADVILSPTGHVRVRPVVPSECARQQVGAAVGIMTPTVLHYLPPESLHGDVLSKSSTMYAAGMLLYEMLSGHLPLVGEASSFMVLLDRINHGVPPIDTLRPDLAPPVAAFVDRLVDRQVASRFDTWDEVSACLAAVRSLLEPTGFEQIAGWLASLPESLRGGVEPLPSIVEIDDWGRLPRGGYEPVEPRKRSPSGEGQPRVLAFSDPDFVYPARDRRPMVAHGSLLIDVRPVTEAEYERFLLETSVPSDLGGDDGPKTRVTFEHAQAYASWAGKRLPTDQEWSTMVDALGAERLGVGEVWEWTTTPRRGGHVVRGGRWRDAWYRPPSAENRSHETTQADDVGFRCVLER